MRTGLKVIIITNVMETSENVEKYISGSKTKY